MKPLTYIPLNRVQTERALSGRVLCRRDPFCYRPVFRMDGGRRASWSLHSRPCGDAAHVGRAQRLASPPLSDSKSVKETLEALRGADDAGNLLGRDRLAQVQNHLVELVGYIEGKEGYTLFAGER